VDVVGAISRFSEKLSQSLNEAVVLLRQTNRYPENTLLTKGSSGPDENVAGGKASDYLFLNSTGWK
jgi:hypothetical protein